MKKLYICTEDRQGGNFAVGSIHTIEGWRQRAMQWYDQDGDEDYGEWLWYIKEDKVIGEIENIWGITIVPLEDLIPIDKYSVPKRLEKLLGYICNNIVALRTMQRFLEDQNEEYSEYVRAILDTAMNIVNEVYGEGEEVW